MKNQSIMKPTVITQFLFINLLILFVHGQTIGQNSLEKTAKNQLYFFFGGHHTKTQDLVYSPLIYKGGGFNAFGLRYQRTTQKGFHRVGIAYDNQNVSSSTPPISFDLFGETIARIDNQAKHFSIHYGYAQQLKQKGKFTYYIGGLLAAKINLLNYNFGLNEETGYALIHSVNPWVVGVFPISSKQYLRAEIYVPLLAYATRPDYSIVDNEEIQYEGSDFAFLYKKGEFASINTLQSIHFSLAYHQKINKLTHLNFSYSLDYLRYTQPITQTLLKNSVDIGIAFYF